MPATSATAGSTTVGSGGANTTYTAGIDTASHAGKTSEMDALRDARHMDVLVACGFERMLR